MVSTRRIGLISDTHGLLRPEAVAALHDCEHILHAGDIGNPEIVATLGRLAPVTVIRGNIDKAAWAQSLPATEMLELCGIWFYIIHDIAELAIDPVSAGIHVVVSGHSHRSSIQRKGGVLFVNPGSAGPRRFSLPVSVGRVLIGDAETSAEIVKVA